MQDKARARSWDPEKTAAFWINRASRLLLRRFDARLRPFGFAMSHLPVLRALADGRPRSQRELAQLAGVEQPSMAETLARMVRDGVVERRPNPHDKRGADVSLTRRSRARLAKAQAALIDCEREVMEDFSAFEKNLLLELLMRVVAKLETDAGPAAPKKRRRATSSS